MCGFQIYGSETGESRRAPLLTRALIVHNGVLSDSPHRDDEKLALPSEVEQWERHFDLEAARRAADARPAYRLSAGRPSA